MKLIKEKRAILFIYIAVSIAASGYFYTNPDYTIPYNKRTKYLNRERDNYDKLKKSLVIEGVGLFLLLGAFAYKGDKEGR
tara:strand:+ start:1219 stop:1458 length:240 start_codon:yes stop_codon:yes gene_type:complete